MDGAAAASAHGWVALGFGVEPGDMMGGDDGTPPTELGAKFAAPKTLINHKIPD